jgi:hypothetical protein
VGEEEGIQARALTDRNDPIRHDVMGERAYSTLASQLGIEPYRGGLLSFLSPWLPIVAATPTAFGEGLQELCRLDSAARERESNRSESCRIFSR